jgi:WD40 repeat protein
MNFIFQLAFCLGAADPAPPIVALSVAPDGKSVVAASQAAVQILSLPDLKAERTLATKLEHVHDLAFSPAGDVLAIAGGSPGERGAVELWDWPAGKLRLELPAGGDLAYRLAWDADGLRLAIAGADKAVRVHPAKGGPPRVIRPHSAAVLTVAWLPVDDLILSAGVDHTIRLLHPFSGATIRSFENHTAAVRDLAIRPGSHDGPVTVASASADRVLVACEDGKLRSVDPATVAITEFAEQLDGWAYAACALPGGREAIISGERGQLRRISLDGIQP